VTAAAATLADAPAQPAGFPGGMTAFASDFAARSPLWTCGECPFQFDVADGHARTLLIGGENATGKSVLAEALLRWAKEKFGCAPMKVTIRERTGAGTYEMAAMRRQMMFGSEEKHSTGSVSAAVVGRAFLNMNNWAEQGVKPLLLLDEPELGLSEGFSHAMGEWIGQQIGCLSGKAFGVIVVSHSKRLGKGLALGLSERPAFAQMDSVQASFEQWLRDSQPRTVDDLLALDRLDAYGHRKMVEMIKAVRSMT